MNMVMGQIPRIIRSKVTVDRFNDFLCNVGASRHSMMTETKWYLTD